MLNSPVLRYELLTLGRRRRYTLLRCAYVVGLLFALWLCYLEAFGWHDWSHDSVLAAYARLATYFFATFTGIQLGAILLLTPAVVAGTIAGEHERRTIDYLLTTHLTDAEITLSKFVARMLAIGYQLLVGLPVLALVMLFGGIEPATLVKVFGYSALILVATASLSLWISASSKQSRSAITTAYLAVIVLVGLPLICLLASEIFSDFRHTAWSDAVMVWNLWSPILMIVASFEDFPSQHQAWHAPQYLVPLYLTASALWLIFAVRAVRRTHNKIASSRRWWSFGRVKASRTVGRDAMLWKETVCQRGVLKLGWIGRLATIVMFAAGYLALGGAVWATVEQEYGPNPGWYYGSNSRDPFGYRTPYADTALHITSCSLSAIVGSFVALLLTARAAGSVTVEKEQDSWLTLVSTPFTAREIVWGKIGGAFYSVRYWYLLLFISWTVGAVRFPYQFATAPLFFAMHLIFGLLCAAIGMFYSLKLRTSLWSIGAALATVVTTFGALPMFVILVLESNHTRQDELNVMGFLAPMFLLAPEHLCARYACDEFSHYDENIFASCIAATLAFATAGVTIANVLVRNFDALIGRVVERRRLTADSPGDEGDDPAVEGDA